MNTIYTQFQQALKREKQYITTYYDNIQYPCLYRKVDDYKNTSNHIEIFYDITTPIKQGQLLIRDGKAFIVINKESIENDTYYKSTIKECNLTIPVIIGGALKRIPCYSYELNSAYNISNNIIRFVDGKGELITELIPELSNSIYINTGLRIMGGYFDVVNTYDIDGIVHIMLEKKVSPSDEYALYLTSDKTSYIEGETTQLTALAMVNDTQDTTATITYSSSNETIATVDDNGLVTFVGIGDVTITSTWVEQSLTKTLGFTVVVDPDAPAYTFTLIFSNPNNEVNMGSSIPRTLTPKLWDVNSDEVPFTAVWSWELPIGYESYFDIEYEGNLAKIKVKTDSSYELLGMTFKAICTTDDGLYTASIDISITI